MKRFFFWFLRSPLVRLIVALTFIIVAVILQGVALYGIRKALKLESTGGRDPVAELLSIATVLFAYWAYVRLVERRPVTELGLKGAGPEFGKGSLLGTLLFSATIGVIALAGGYRVAGVNGLWALWIPFVMSISAGFVEEVITRGVIFRIVEDGMGSWFALILSSAFFGFAHTLNPGATVFSSVAIAIEAGLLLGLAFMYTRRLWFPMGLHFAWNFAQGGLFGVPISGLAVDGLLRGELSGSPRLTGGSFGPEASFVAVIICPLAAVTLGYLAVRMGHTVGPFWTRRGKPTADVILTELPPPLDRPGDDAGPSAEPTGAEQTGLSELS